MQVTFIAHIMGNTIDFGGSLGEQEDSDILSFKVDYTYPESEDHEVDLGAEISLYDFTYSTGDASGDPIKGWVVDEIYDAVLSYISNSKNISYNDIVKLRDYDEVTLPLDYDLRRVKALEQEYEYAIECLRKNTGKKLLRDIQRDANLPVLLSDLINTKKIDKLFFEKITTSEDYMPDNCLYIVLCSQTESFSIRTDEVSENFDVSGYERDDSEITSGVDFVDILSEDGCLNGSPYSFDDGLAAYDYLIKMKDDLARQDYRVFRQYIIERN